jgi:hypothetical protein
MTWRRWLVDILLIAAGVVSVIFEPLSIAIHSVIGLAFTGAVGPHLWNRRSWIRGTLRRLRQRRRLTPRLRWSLGQSVLLAVLVVVVTASGLWDWLSAEPTRIRFHALYSVILIVVAGWHGWTRRSWLTRRRAAASAEPPETQASVGAPAASEPPG